MTTPLITEDPVRLDVAGRSGAPQLRIMAAAMLAGMVPPIALAATTVRPGHVDAAERENAQAGRPLGASCVTEGEILFAAADPMIPAIMLAPAGQAAGADPVRV